MLPARQQLGLLTRPQMHGKLACSAFSELCIEGELGQWSPHACWESLHRCVRLRGQHRLRCWARWAADALLGVPGIQIVRTGVLLSSGDLRSSRIGAPATAECLTGELALEHLPGSTVPRAQRLQPAPMRGGFSIRVALALVLLLAGKWGPTPHLLVAGCSAAVALPARRDHSPAAASTAAA